MPQQYIDNVISKDGTEYGLRPADGTVTSAKISTSAVVTGKISANAITTAKIATSAVTESKIADGTITSAKFAPEVISWISDVTGGVESINTYQGAITLSTGVVPGAFTLGDGYTTQTISINGLGTAAFSQADSFLSSACYDLVLGQSVNMSEVLSAYDAGKLIRVDTTNVQFDPKVNDTGVHDLNFLSKSGETSIAYMIFNHGVNSSNYIADLKWDTTYASSNGWSYINGRDLINSYSPAFTGIPTTPDITNLSTSTSQIANAAFVQAVVQDKVAAAVSSAMSSIATDVIVAFEYGSQLASAEVTGALSAFDEGKIVNCKINSNLSSAIWQGTVTTLASYSAAASVTSMQFLGTIGSTPNYKIVQVNCTQSASTTWQYSLFDIPEISSVLSTAKTEVSLTVTGSSVSTAITESQIENYYESVQDCIFTGSDGYSYQVASYNGTAHTVNLVAVQPDGTLRTVALSAADNNTALSGTLKLIQPTFDVVYGEAVDAAEILNAISSGRQIRCKTVDTDLETTYYYYLANYQLDGSSLYNLQFIDLFPNLLEEVVFYTWDSDTNSNNGWSSEIMALVTHNSPTFTGTPKAPTASTSTSTTQIATTEFVHNVASSDTYKEAYIVTYGDTLDYDTIVAKRTAGKIVLCKLTSSISPGIPADTFLQLQTYSYTPSGGGAGYSILFAGYIISGNYRVTFTCHGSTKSCDTWSHSMTFLAPIASPNFSGTPTAPTASAATNSTQIATTAFVKTAISGITHPTEVFIIDYGDESKASQLSAAYAAGKSIWCRYTEEDEEDGAWSSTHLIPLTNYTYEEDIGEYYIFSIFMTPQYQEDEVWSITLLDGYSWEEIRKISFAQQSVALATYNGNNYIKVGSSGLSSGTKNIYIQSTQPYTNNVGDIWIDIS